MDVARSERGRNTAPAQRCADGAKHREEVPEIRVETSGGAADALKPDRQFVSFGLRNGRTPIDVMYLFEKTAKPLRHSDQRRFQVLELVAPEDSFQQPGAERVEMFDAGKVDDHIIFLCID